jgi:hypothetical protein
VTLRRRDAATTADFGQAELSASGTLGLLPPPLAGEGIVIAGKVGHFGLLFQDNAKIEPG